jgi:formate dehydrogenase alpha subunit
MGENPARSLPQPDRVAAALQKLDLLVVQDILFTRTAAMAHYILPGAAAAEKAGSFTNMEGRIQTFSQAAAPPGEARPDWEILSLLIRKMGHPEQYPSLEKIRREIRRQVPIYQDLGAHRQGWVASAGSGAKLSFATDFSPVTVAADKARPFVARISPVRHHLGSGTRTSRSGRIREYNDPGAVEISVEDCRALGLSDAGKVRLASEWGRIERSYVRSSRLPSGLVIVPMGENQNDAMALAALSGSDRAGGFTGTTGRINVENIGSKE